MRKEERDRTMVEVGYRLEDGLKRIPWKRPKPGKKLMAVLRERERCCYTLGTGNV